MRKTPPFNLILGNSGLVILTFEKGTLILIECTARVKDSEEIIDTTRKKDAEIDPAGGPESQHQPKLIALGESWVLKGLDEALANAAAGDELTVDIPPEKAFGARDSGKIRMVPLRKLGDDAEKTSVGDEVEIDRRKGVIRFMSSGRVKIDFNHKHAGKTITYDVKVLKSLDSDDEKIHSLLKRHLVDDYPKLQLKHDADNLDISIPQSLFRTEGLPSIKHLIQKDLFKFVPSLYKISFIETYENPAKKPGVSTTGGTDTPTTGGTDTPTTGGTDTPTTGGTDTPTTGGTDTPTTGGTDTPTTGGTDTPTTGGTDTPTTGGAGRPTDDT